VVPGGKTQHLLYLYLVPGPSESDALVDLTAPAEGGCPLHCFRQTYMQQAQLTATPQGFKLDVLLITVA